MAQPGLSQAEFTLNLADRADTICIVEDDEAVRDSMCALVESCGHAVRDYSSAEAFLDDLHDQEPACLLLDLRLPGMSGLELLELLRDRRIATPTIIVTADPDTVRPERVRGAGALALLGKPVADDLLISWIERALDHSPSAH